MTLSLTRTLSTAAFLVSLATAPALAQGTGSEGYFTLFNNTEGNVLVGFYTNDGTGWSDNWLAYAVFPGESGQAQFSADIGYCDQVFAAGWLGGDGEGEVVDDPISIDICAASNVYLGDNEIYYD